MESQSNNFKPTKFTNRLEGKAFLARSGARRRPDDMGIPDMTEHYFWDMPNGELWSERHSYGEFGGKEEYLLQLIEQHAS